ncbi:hypothetical protein N658DRAFT_9635 [Parathielavia hyrcaniae]|uniref:Uncharacterized protein n=1 Tax=Parathielavia hyrcaniae TaxID=113614 RepID=A0AAN6T6L8_9PEZI|nr:hypothetical protein N658DRAFT_9635 [Parathielavia hyrcaniae]
MGLLRMGGYVLAFRALRFQDWDFRVELVKGVIPGMLANWRFGNISSSSVDRMSYCEWQSAVSLGSMLVQRKVKRPLAGASQRPYPTAAELESATAIGSRQCSRIILIRSNPVSDDHRLSTSLPYRQPAPAVM